jgi:hypothetical protein
MTTTTTSAAATTTMDWLWSEPLLDAALAQTKSLEQFAAVQDSFRAAEEKGQEIPDTVREKLMDKEKQLWSQLVDDQINDYLSQSGLGALVSAKRSWDDVHFMAEAHGVGSSIPMVSYTGLSQEEIEAGMESFYAYMASHKLQLEHPTLQQQVATQLFETYKELYECITGEFGGYDPFDSMLQHSPDVVAAALGVESGQQ